MPSDHARELGGPPPPLRLVTRSSLTDDALCRAFLAGDRHAFGELVQRHQPLVYNLVRRYADNEDAGDLAQRAFLQAFAAARRALPRLGSAGVPFKAWLLRIAMNLGKNHARAARRWRPVPVAEAGSLLTQPATAPDALERSERAKAARAAVLALPRRQREVLTLRIDGGLTFSEIADALGIQVGNAKSHFSQAVRRLREAVADRGDGP